MSSEKKLYGWYSETQKKFAENFRAIDLNGKLIKYKILKTLYLNQYGNEIEVTEVSDNMNHTPQYDDSIFIGKLGKFLRTEIDRN